jgi:hypothetical protein
LPSAGRLALRRRGLARNNFTQRREDAKCRAENKYHRRKC